MEVGERLLSFVVQHGDAIRTQNPGSLPNITAVDMFKDGIPPGLFLLVRACQDLSFRSEGM